MANRDERRAEKMEKSAQMERQSLVRQHYAAVGKQRMEKSVRMG